MLTVDGLGAGAYQVIVEARDAQGRFLRGDSEPLTYVEVDPEEPIEVRPESVVRLSGWATTAGREADIAAFLRGNGLIPIAYRFERPDIAEAFGESALLAGFESTFDTARIVADGGRYEIVLIAPDGRSLVASGMALRFSAAPTLAPRRTLRLSGD